MKILLTGSNGFLGSTLVSSFLDNDHHVLSLVRNSSQSDRLLNYYQHPRFSIINIHSVDVDDVIVKFNADVFIHSAWKGVDSLNRDNKQNIKDNIEFLQNCLDLLAISGCKKWIGIGSLTEYGDLGRIVVESDNPEANTLYANTKLAALYISKSICKSLDISWCWVRLGSIYGKGDNPNWLIPYLIRSLEQNSAPSLTKCEQVWDYLHVEDASDAIMRLADSDCEGLYNLCSSIPIRLIDIVDFVFKNSHIKPFLGSKDYSESQVMFLVGNNQKIKHALNWEPKRDLKVELQKLINFNN